MDLSGETAGCRFGVFMIAENDNPETQSNNPSAPPPSKGLSFAVPIVIKRIACPFDHPKSEAAFHLYAPRQLTNAAARLADDRIGFNSYWSNAKRVLAISPKRVTIGNRLLPGSRA